MINHQVKSGELCQKRIEDVPLGEAVFNVQRDSKSSMDLMMKNHQLKKLIEATLETKLISSDHCDPLLSHPNSVLTSHAFEILRAVLALILLYL